MGIARVVGRNEKMPARGGHFEMQMDGDGGYCGDNLRYHNTVSPSPDLSVYVPGSNFCVTSYNVPATEGIVV